MYFMKKNKCKFLHHLYMTIVHNICLMCKKEETKKITENHVQSHPVGIWPPLQPSWSRVQRQKPLPPLQINLKPLITVLHLLDHHSQCYQHLEAVSQLLDCTEGYKSIPKQSKTPPKYFHYANAVPAPSPFNKSCSGSMQKLF